MMINVTGPVGPQGGKTGVIGKQVKYSRPLEYRSVNCNFIDWSLEPQEHIST